MKKIGLLTLDAKSFNYGGILQEYALLSILNDYGNAEIINYDVRSERNTFSIYRSVANFSLYKVLGKINACRLKKKAIDIDVSFEINKRKEKFELFRNEFLLFSKEIKYPELSIYTNDYNAVVCGSDQIWNPDYNIPAFFLDFKFSGKKIIYGASIGKNKLTKRQKKVYKKYLDKLENVSVREKSALDILLCSTNKEIVHVIDPTLLLDKDKWQKIIKPYKINDDYIFCYFLSYTDEKVDAVRMMAKKYGYKVITIPYLHNHYEDYSEKVSDMLVSDVGPREFLALINNAKGIITDSFHASLFSLLFDKPFWVFGRNTGIYNMNTRLDSLLDCFDAKDRMITPKQLYKKNLDEICYNKSNLEKYKKNSLAFIEKSLN